MSCLTQVPQQGAVSSKAVSIAALLVSGLEHRLEVVEHQQATPIPQELKQRGKSCRLGYRWNTMLVRQEADCACQPLANRQRVAQAPPVHPFKVWCGLLG